MVRENSSSFIYTMIMDKTDLVFMLKIAQDIATCDNKSLADISVTECLAKYDAYCKDYFDNFDSDYQAEIASDMAYEAQ